MSTHEMCCACRSQPLAKPDDDIFCSKCEATYEASWAEYDIAEMKAEQAIERRFSEWLAFPGDRHGFSDHDWGRP